MYEYNSNCLENCPNDKKAYEEGKLCLDECDPYQFEYNNLCYNDCPNGIFRIFINRNICIETIPDNYYLDRTDNIYKECYNKCKKCNKERTDANNNCDECINGYMFLNETFATIQNCYGICDNLYYFNEEKQYICITSNECPQEFNKLIVEKKKCIDLCKNDNDYMYEYKNTCLRECPDNTKLYEEEKLCLDECYPEQFEYNNKCYDDCPNGKYKLFDKRNICVDSIPDNFYLDINDNIYKECFITNTKINSLIKLSFLLFLKKILLLYQIFQLYYK